MRRLAAFLMLVSLAALAPVRPAAAADPHVPLPAGGLSGAFLATCEDQARFCFADACGRDQIEASLRCRAVCPSAAIMSVVPTACPIPDVAAPSAVLRRRG